MAEAEKMADRVAILLRGKLVATGTPRELTASGAGFTKVSIRSEQSLLCADPIAFRLCASGTSRMTAILTARMATPSYFSTDPGPTVSAILDYLKGKQDRLIDLRVERPSLGAVPGDHDDRRCGMKALANHFAFEFKTGLRDSNQLLMNYLFPLAFYALMGLVMTKINPLFAETMVPALVIFAALASTLLGLPGPLVELREAGIYRSYRINGFLPRRSCWCRR